MLFLDNGSTEGDVRLTDYGSCHENAFHFCNAEQELELKNRISKCQNILTMEEFHDGSWRLCVLLSDADDDVNHILDIFDTVFAVTDSFVKEIFDSVQAASAC